MSDFNNEPLVQLGKYKGVEGWLLLFCFVLTIFSPLSTLYNLVVSYNETSQYFSQYHGLQNLLYIDGFLSIVLMILSIRAGIALWRIRPGAVKIAKIYLFIYLSYSVVSIFLPFTVGLPSEFNDAMIAEVTKDAIRSLLYFVIWYWYLSLSKRVAATYVTFSNSEVSENTLYESEKTGINDEK